MPKGVYERTEEHRQKIGAARRGKRLSAETRAKMSAAKKGRRPANFEAFLAKAHVAPKPSGEQHPCWKGDDVGYSGLHEWVRKTLGRPQKCQCCSTKKARRYEWSNVSGEYRREAEDWVRLCVSCHRKEGYAKGEYEPWNKGKRVQTNTGRTHIKPGQRISPETEFKPGLVPHNKRLKPRRCLACRRRFQPPNSIRKFCCRQCYWDSLRDSRET